MAEVILVVLLIVVGVVCGMVCFLCVIATGLERSATGASDGALPALAFGVASLICLGVAAAFIFT
jgi:hypothetical protein